MTINETRLPNGMRVVSCEMPHLETVSMGIWVGVGARHETAPEQGISHLLEHMAFKGTQRRTALAIAEEIEAVGGELNAATSLETTAYYSRVLAGDIPLALDILADILQSPRHSEEELEREREVILQEIAATRDSPDEIAYELLQEVAFPDQAIGRPILGTAASVRGFKPTDLRRFLEANYRANRMVLSAAGKIEHAELVRHAEALFGRMNGGEGGRFESARYGGGTRTSAKPFEQSHFLLAFEGPSYAHDGYYTAQVFSALFGGGMSSRLFQEVREKRGLVYAIHSFSHSYRDGGLFGIYAGTGEDEAAELMPVLCDETMRLADGLSAGELARAKAQMKAGLLMSLESTGARCEQMATHMLVHGTPFDPAEIVRRVEAVDGDAIGRVVARWGGAAPTLTALGPLGRLEDFERLRARLGA
ncbi:MAG TPA: pitrilysin family protein [Hyphomicrobiaceae bacterium]